ncbi:MAG: membrane dipeptidase [Clostridia bacterium]|nr:membrane dipeptidase [Clostridia bacterium]
MKNLSLIDTHCDTAFELYHRKQSLLENNCHVSLKKAEKYENYAHFFAIWADRRRSDDDCYDDFLKISDNLFAQIEKNEEKVVQARNFGDMQSAFESGKRAIFLAVEDARILGGKIERLDELKARGVTYLTLLWGGETCIGASHDTEGGLTDFGREVVKRAFELGIIPDVSHANERVTDEVTEIAYTYKKPFMASHSNCFDVYGHTRNLRLRHLDALIDLGGAVGLNLCPWHIAKIEDGKDCKLDHVMRHVEGFLERGAENILGMGCDLDGTDLPDGFDGIDDLERIAEEMARRNYSDALIEKIFWKNHFEFVKNNLK